MIETAQKNKTVTPEEREQYRAQYKEAGNRIVQHLFLQEPPPDDELNRLQETLDGIPPAIAAELDIEFVKTALQIVRANAERTRQISLFPEGEDNTETTSGKVFKHLMSMIPREHLMPNHKLANEITKDLVGAGQTYLKVASNKSKKPIPIICDLAYDEEKIQIVSRRPLTEYDRNVYNAITSLYVGGDPSHIVTPAMVYRAMTGMSATEKPTPQQIDAITKSLDRMSCIRVRVDCTQELNARRMALNLGGCIKAGHIGTYLLNTKDCYIEAGGKVLRAYKIEEAPILYSYSKELNQVVSVSSHLLDVKAVDAKTGQITGRIANTESRIAIKGYLLRRIEVMKNPNNKQVSHNVSLLSYERDGRHHAGLYEIAGNAAPTTKDATRIRSYVSAALDYWKTEGYIKGYAWIKRGRQIVSVKILL